MPVSKPPRPPMLITLHTQVRSALESFIFNPVPTSSEPEPTLYDLLTNVAPTNNSNAYFLAQYICCLYAGVFMNWTTSIVYRTILMDISDIVRSAASNNTISDALLRKFIMDHPLPAVEDEIMFDRRAMYAETFIKDFEAVVSRIQPDKAYPGIGELARFVCAMASVKPVIAPKVMLHQLLLRNVEGYDLPTLVLAPLVRVDIDTTLPSPSQAVYWRFVHSINIPALIDQPGAFSYWMQVLAMLALPIDPVALNTSLYFNGLNNAKAKIPFANYLAMYIKQREIGFDYQLSRLANARRLLLNSLHKFCGVGSVGISDRMDAHFFFEQLRTMFDMTNIRSVMTPDEIRMFSALGCEVDANDHTNTMFDRRLTYEEANEALKAVQSGKPVDPDLDPKTAKVKKTPRKKTGDKTDPDPPADPDEGDDGDDAPGAFADDPQDLIDDESTLGNQDDPPGSDGSQTVDDNIDQGGGLQPKVQPASRLLPLALSDETVDDHIYRIGVLKFVTSTDQTSNLDIPPETLMILRTWCELWLFIASVKKTKQLMAQLKVANHLKEFVA